MTTDQLHHGWGHDRRAPVTLSHPPNQRWSLDFVSAVLAEGRRFVVLVIVDDFTRECLALVADTALQCYLSVRELDTIFQRHGKPLIFVSDNVTELTSYAVLRWQ